jgi:hypothetical protein
VKACGATASTKEHFIATRRFTKKPEREKLLTMEKPIEHFQCLTMKYEWMNKKG